MTSSDTRPQKRLALALQQWLIDAICVPPEDLSVTARKNNEAYNAPWTVMTMVLGEPVMRVDVNHEGCYTVFRYDRFYSEIDREPHEHDHSIKNLGKYSGWHMSSAESVVRSSILLRGLKLDL